MKTPEKIDGIKELGKLAKGHRGRILSLGKTATCRCTAADCDSVVHRLLEMGLVEGSEVEIMHEAAFEGDPIAIRVRGALLALRRHEANHAMVEEITP